MHYLLLVISLILFWLALSGHFSALLLSLGVLSVLLVTWLVGRMDRVDREPSSLYPSFGLVSYGFWLLWMVVKSNLDMVFRIWAPSLPIQPAWCRLQTKVATPREKTLYANSITLTPGTLTTDVQDDHFWVHSLCHDAIANLRTGEMERRIRRLGI
jgi:multicomponent Na+:H+ antiporter subunit E